MKREDIYKAIEDELVRQEAAEESHGKKMWEMLGNDPRELITIIMSQLRDCATSLTNPIAFQTALLRAGCLIVASLQWTSAWITRLKMRDAALHAGPTCNPPGIHLIGESERKGLVTDDMIAKEIQQAEEEH